MRTARLCSTPALVPVLEKLCPTPWTVSEKPGIRGALLPQPVAWPGRSPWLLGCWRAAVGMERGWDGLRVATAACRRLVWLPAGESSLG